MTEEEAKDKWCPFILFRLGEIGGYTNRGDIYRPSTCKCIASGCMAWKKEGYCGLVK
jgi:hypothetical protein